MAECDELFSKTAKAMMMVNMKVVIQIVDKYLHWYHLVLQYNSIIIIDKTQNIN